MPLYELFCVAAIANESVPLRELIRTTSRTILDHGGAVRGMQYWGRRTLPQRTRKHQTTHTAGDHFFLQFDTNSRVLETINKRFRNDPRVVKWTMLKLGEKLTKITPRSAHGDIDMNVEQHPSQMGGGKTIFVHEKS